MICGKKIINVNKNYKIPNRDLYEEEKKKEYIYSIKNVFFFFFLLLLLIFQRCVFDSSRMGSR